jgi:hypothetical protein
MNHPFISDLSAKTTEELSETINTLANRLHFVSARRDQHVMNQINMALSSYRAEYQRRQQAAFEKESVNLDKKINIS